MNKQKLETLRKSNERVAFLKDFYAYLSRTAEEDWCTGVCRKEGNRQQNCFIGHLANFMEVADEENVSQVIDVFESGILTSYVYYRVNDGEHPGYRQNSPKKRCLQMVLDLISGRLIMTLESMEIACSRLPNYSITFFSFVPDVDFSARHTLCLPKPA